MSAWRRRRKKKLFIVLAKKNKFHDFTVDSHSCTDRVPSKVHRDRSDKLRKSFNVSLIQFLSSMWKLSKSRWNRLADQWNCFTDPSLNRLFSEWTRFSPMFIAEIRRLVNCNLDVLQNHNFHNLSYCEIYVGIDLKSAPSNELQFVSFISFITNHLKVITVSADLLSK